MANFDFGEHINDENKAESFPLTEMEENCLSPYGVLCAELGRTKGKKLFATLLRITKRISDVKGGRPAILLDEEGGEFVSIISEQE